MPPPAPAGGATAAAGRPASEKTAKGPNTQPGVTEKGTGAAASPPPAGALAGPEA